MSYWGGGVSNNGIQWNPSCEATPFASEKWPFKRGGLSSGVDINTFMFKFTLPSGLYRGGCLSSGWLFKRGLTVHVRLFHFPIFSFYYSVGWKLASTRNCHQLQSLRKVCETEWLLANWHISWHLRVCPSKRFMTRTTAATRSETLQLWKSI